MPQLNWVDWTILAALVYYAVQGWTAGFADLGFTFITFFVSLWLAIKFHAPVGDFIADKFGVPPNWTTVLGYIIVGFVAEAILAEITSLIMSKLPKKLLESKFNKWLGIVVSIFNGIVIVSFILLVLLALPLRGTIKSDVNSSVIGGRLVGFAQKYGSPIESTIEQVRDKAVAFFTIDPESTESIQLDVAPTESDLEIDDPAERDMLALLNAEREKAGLIPFTVEVRIVPVARNHSRDMFLRRYFSHITPEGLTPADRLDKGGVTYRVAGENLAYAPDVKTAHEGLMNSPGHKRNILDPNFRHIGIGIISTDKFGMMITQNFTN